MILPDLELRADTHGGSNVHGHNTHSAVEPNVRKTALKSSQLDIDPNELSRSGADSSKVLWLDT